MSAKKTVTLDLTNENATLQVLPRMPALSSHKAGWDGIRLAYHRQPAYATPVYSVLQHLIIIHIGCSFRSERGLDGRFRSQCMSDGDIDIVPIHVTSRAIWDRDIEFISLSLEPAFFLSAVAEAVEAQRVELVPHATIRDPLIQQIGLALKTALATDNCCCRLYAESLFTALSVHLLKYYCARRQPVPQYSYGLPKHKLRRAIDYIHEYMEQDLTLTEIAAVVGLSPYHFAREFKQSTGKPPHQYLVACRVEKAKRLLAQSQLSIAEIACCVGWSQNHFTRLFRQHTGKTPKAYRNAL